jgi:tetrahydromethanopterin S-methyltransferase subunit G
MFEILLGIAFITLASKVGPAWARRIEGQGADPELARRLAEAEERVAQMEERLLSLAAESHERMLEVEERVDFTERVLQQQRAGKRLGEGG